jgi:hypothetical protein
VPEQITNLPAMIATIVPYLLCPHLLNTPIYINKQTKVKISRNRGFIGGRMLIFFFPQSQLSMIIASTTPNITKVIQNNDEWQYPLAHTCY